MRIWRRSDERIITVRPLYGSQLMTMISSRKCQNILTQSGTCKLDSGHPVWTVFANVWNWLSLRVAVLKLLLRHWKSLLNEINIDVFIHQCVIALLQLSSAQFIRDVHFYFSWIPYRCKRLSSRWSCGVALYNGFWWIASNGFWSVSMVTERPYMWWWKFSHP